MLAFLRRNANALLWPAFALATIAFYSIPLFFRNTTIHWDLADVTYPAQKFFADALRLVMQGKSHLPHWAPYLLSGIPFLADPRTGAWYPLHWPFFAIGVTPRAMFWELALHTFFAMGGAYLLALRLFNARGAALLAGVMYACGGYFAAHASLLSGFETAALFPWLVWGALAALESDSLRWMAFTSLILGLIVLAGDPPAALESLLALICVTSACVVAGTKKWGRGATLLISAAVLALMLGAIQILPAIQLHSQSHPAPSAARFHFNALATLVAADYYNLISGLYIGPEDPRQFYLYSGLLLVPLAVAGAVRRERWPLLLALIVPTVVFDLARRPPGDAWFPAALGLAMAAASGVVWVETRMERPLLWIALLALSAVDLWFWNIYRNPLVLAHATFTELYGPSPATAGKRPFARTWAPYVPVGFGPADGALITRTEVTYGSGIAELDRYTAYLASVEKNTKLLNGLGVTDLLLGRGRGAFAERLDNPATLGRVSAPPHVDFVADRNAALAALATLDPARSAVVEAPARALTPAVRSLEITSYAGDSYRIKYSASSESLLRIAAPYYPGWTATVNGAGVEVLPVDEALLGVFVPAGDHEVTLEFQPPWFLLGVSLSLAAAVALVIGLILT